MYASHKMWVDAVARDMANIDESFTSQAASAVAPHALVSAVVAAAIAGMLHARVGQMVLKCNDFKTLLSKGPFFGMSAA